MKNSIITALKTGNGKKIKQALSSALSEKREETLAIKKIAVASDVFNQEGK